MNNVEKPWVLITGANGGIGRALVEEFVNSNYRVIATDIVVSNFEDKIEKRKERREEKKKTENLDKFIDE